MKWGVTYLDANQQPLAVWTGRKLRMYPRGFAVLHFFVLPLPALIQFLLARQQHIQNAHPQMLAALPRVRQL